VLLGVVHQPALRIVENRLLTGGVDDVGNSELRGRHHTGVADTPIAELRLAIGVEDRGQAGPALHLQPDEFVGPVVLMGID
jgi:hypothetical protein